ncbi:response regulator transcription factor [Chryseolinea lacunae]|uniref:Response regulator transcription factor n=1 Tax=Chryseolinea lacunae TaxID=2801331 RepID=A0ABS1L5L5_9BACT|nr:response regulator transcription factor [Chryseolinea lacunae]MBL0745821.1 response regulator transcription factor [Chryseolinea lacunae]
MDKKTKVLIADDHGLMRQGLISLLKDETDIDIVGTVESGESAVNLAKEKSPDVILMDIVMRGMTGIEATRWIKEQNPKIKIILISSEVSKDFITLGIKSGIDGYLPKDSDKETLLQAIHKVMQGERHFSAEITALVFEDFYLKEKVGKGLPTKKASELSKREEEVLVLIAEGKTLKQIAEMLFISVKTVETHKMHIQDKLGLNNTAQLVMYAIEHDLIAVNKKKT